MKLIPIWLKSLFTPRPIEIWKDIKCEYLRREMVWGTCPQDMHDMYIYAIHQVSLTTGNKRIFEKWDYFPMEEFDKTKESTK